MGRWRRVAGMAAALASIGLPGAPSLAQATFNEAVARILADRMFDHAQVGIEVYSLDRGKRLFALNAEKLFTPGSTTKVVTEGAALALLGPDFRFRTRVFRTGPVKNGTLNGGLVLVAAGDPNLSGRIRPDGTLTFTDDDHSYGGPPLPGDPAGPLAAMAKQIAARGIRRITGRIMVDASMFDPVREVGLRVIVSPVAVNDNVVDLIVSPAAPGSPAKLRVSPAVAYLTFDNRVRTGKAGDETRISHVETTGADGRTHVEVRGVVAPDHGPAYQAYPVDDPPRFAAALLVAELARQGIRVDDPNWSPRVPEAPRDAGHQVAVHISPPLREDVRITLKVSQNLHAMMMPYVIGNVLGHATGAADHVGFRFIHDWLEKAGLDLAGGAQWDGEGNGAWTPHFMNRYLAYLASRPDFPIFYEGLPILGRDGTLADLLVDSKAAGAVRAKTGSNVQSDLLNDGMLVEGKGLVGYTTTPGGEKVALSLFLNKVPVSAGPGGKPSAISRYVQIVGGAAAKIAEGLHLLPIDEAVRDTQSR